MACLSPEAFPGCLGNPCSIQSSCGTAQPLYWGCHSENIEFTGSVEWFQSREGLVPETGSELEKCLPLPSAGRLGLMLMGEDEAILKHAEFCPSPWPSCPGGGWLLEDVQAISIPISALAFKEHKLLCLPRKNVPGSAAALAEMGSLLTLVAMLCFAQLSGAESPARPVLFSGISGLLFSFVDG